MRIIKLQMLKIPCKNFSKEKFFVPAKKLIFDLSD